MRQLENTSRFRAVGCFDGGEAHYGGSWVWSLGEPSPPILSRARGSGSVRVVNKSVYGMLLRFRMASPRLLTALFRASMPESPVNAVCGVQLRYKPFTGARWKYIYSDDDSCAGIAHRAGSGVRAAFLDLRITGGSKGFCLVGRRLVQNNLCNQRKTNFIFL